MSKVKFFKGESANLPGTGSAESLYLTTDTGRLYYSDEEGSMIPITVAQATATVPGVVLPAAVRTTAPTLSTGSTPSNRYYGVELTSEGKMFVNVPWTNTTYSAATTTSSGLMSSTDKKSLDSLKGAVTTEGTGAAYTATVNHISSLTKGASFIMVPNVVSTSKTCTLDVNSLGAKGLRRRVAGNAASAPVAGRTAGWLSANYPYRVTYDGTYWIVEGQEQSMIADLYGTKLISAVAQSSVTSTNFFNGYGGTYNTFPDEDKGVSMLTTYGLSSFIVIGGTDTTFYTGESYNDLKGYGMSYNCSNDANSQIGWITITRTKAPPSDSKKYVVGANIWLQSLHDDTSGTGNTTSANTYAKGTVYYVVGSAPTAVLCKFVEFNQKTYSQFFDKIYYMSELKI